MLSGSLPDFSPSTARPQPRRYGLIEAMLVHLFTAAAAKEVRWVVAGLLWEALFQIWVCCVKSLSRCLPYRGFPIGDAGRLHGPKIIKMARVMAITRAGWRGDPDLPAWYHRDNQGPGPDPTERVAAGCVCCDAALVAAFAHPAAGLSSPARRTAQGVSPVILVA